jgi:C4-dicarboxylate-specific signal transduction histidine kinase
VAVHCVISEARTEVGRQAGNQWIGASAACPRCQAGLAGLLHDIGQPLAAIRALASSPLSAEGAGEGADGLSERLRQIAELGEWMNDLLRSGGWAAPAARKGPPSADAEQVVQEVLLAAAASFEGALHWRASGQAPVQVDPLELRRAFGNVVDNATRAAGPQGWVQVRIRRARGRVCLEVEDNGPGFGRLRPHTRRGLAVTQTVLDRCGGVLEIASGRSGGALVRLKLPPAAIDLSA